MVTPKVGQPAGSLGNPSAMTISTDRDPAPLPEHLGFLAGGGLATRLILDRDWTVQPLGEPATWPDGLKATLSAILNSPESMILVWGWDELTFFFNETYFPLLGPHLSWAMGAPFQEVWADAWEQAKPIVDDAFAGRNQRFNDLPWKFDTDSRVEDTWFMFPYSRGGSGPRSPTRSPAAWTSDTAPWRRGPAATQPMRLSPPTASPTPASASTKPFSTPSAGSLWKTGAVGRLTAGARPQLGAGPRLRGASRKRHAVGVIGVRG